MLLTTAADVGAHSVSAATTPKDKRFLRFKQRMMPRVGTRMTIRGRLTSGKLGDWISFQGWGAYIVAVHDADIGRLNTISPMLQRQVQVTGILRYSPGSPSGSNSVASVPEHFYFDIAETNIAIIPAPSRRTP